MADRWTSEQFDRANRLARLGFSARQIGHAIGKSCVSVQSKLRRDGVGLCESRARREYEKRTMHRKPQQHEPSLAQVKWLDRDHAEDDHEPRTVYCGHCDLQLYEHQTVGGLCSACAATYYRRVKALR